MTIDTTGTSDFGRWRAARIAYATVAIVIWSARGTAADPVQPDPLGLVFCNGGAGSQTPIGLETPYPLTPGSCVKTQTDDYTVVGGYYDMQCGAAGASSMQEQSASGYQVGTASVGFAPAGFGSLAIAELNAQHGGPAAARTWGYFVDEVTITGGSGHGTFVVPLHVTGTSYVYATREAGVQDPTVHAGISVQCVESTNPITSCNGILLDFSSQANLQNTPTPIDQTIEMTIPFDFGTPADFAVYGCSVASMAAFTDLAGTVSVDFSHTAVIQRATVLDGSGQEVPGATVTSASGFDYLGAPAGTSTTTTTLTSPTTSTLVASAPCSGLAGIAGARCMLESALATPLCSDPVPAGLAHALQQKLGAADRLLGRATGASGAKQTRLVKKAKGKIAGVGHKAMAAVGARNPKKRITAGCGASIIGLVSTAESDLP